MALRDLGGAGLRRAPRGRAGFVALACALYAAVGVATGWPAVKHARSHFLAAPSAARGGAPPGDYLQSGYRLWLVGHQLGQARAPWRDPYSFQPEVRPLVNFAGWPFGLPYWPLFGLFGAVGAWNVFLLLTYVGAGAFTCAWLRTLGVPRGAALVGGVVFAIAPYRVEQSTGHLVGPVAILLPLALWAFERARAGGRGWHAVAAVALASIPLSGQVHLALAAIPLFVAYAFVRALGAADVVGAALAAATAVVAGLLVWRVSIHGSLESGGRSLHEVRHYSAGWLDLVTRHARHGSERFVFLGWVTPVLAAAGAILLFRSGRAALALVLTLGALIPIALALGTNLPTYAPLWHALPPLRYPRVPERLLPVGLLCLAALVAFCAARTRSRVLVPALLVVVLFADLHVERYAALAADPDNRAYAALRAAPAGRVLGLPVFRAGTDLGSVYDYYELQAPRERPSGYSTVAPRKADRVLRRLRRLNCGNWIGARAELAALGVRYVALHASLYAPGRWPRRCLAPARAALRRRGLRPLAADGGIALYSVRAPPGRSGSQPASRSASAATSRGRRVPLSTR